MRLDLRDIINVPGSGVTFDYEPDLTDALSDSLVGVKSPVKASGSIRNIADAQLQCRGRRSSVLFLRQCLKDFEYPVHLTIETTLKESEDDEDESDVFS